eukprot:768396-Hanusia_phi.AAC.1
MKYLQLALRLLLHPVTASEVSPPKPRAEEVLPAADACPNEAPPADTAEEVEPKPKPPPVDAVVAPVDAPPPAAPVDPKPKPPPA